MSNFLFKIEYLAEAGPALIHLKKVYDERGAFSKIFSSEVLQKELPFEGVVQTNLSFSKTKGTVRGLHFQNYPFEEAKIIYCLSGSVNDYLIDLRSDSPNLGRVYKIKLSNRSDMAIFIPRGFAHGFQTLQNDTNLLYFHDQAYNLKAESGISFFSPELSIKLDLSVSIISNRDKKLPVFEV